MAAPEGEAGSGGRGWFGRARLVREGEAGSGGRAEDESAHKLALKLGVFLPADSTFRSINGDTWFATGIDYNPGLRYRPLGGVMHVGSDAAFRSSGNVVSITGKIVWPLTPKMGTRFWGAFGAGGYFINTNTIAGFATPGVKFSFGANITERWFFEADYDYVSGFTDNAGNGQRADGVTVSIGFRL